MLILSSRSWGLEPYCPRIFQPPRRPSPPTTATQNPQGPAVTERLPVLAVSGEIYLNRFGPLVVKPFRERFSKLAGQGSNLQPPDSKSGVLPVELPAISALHTTTLWAKLTMISPWPIGDRTEHRTFSSSAPEPMTGRETSCEFASVRWHPFQIRLASVTSWDR